MFFYTHSRRKRDTRLHSLSLLRSTVYKYIRYTNSGIIKMYEASWPF